MMICLFCKKEIPDGSSYCNHCGRKQERSRHRLPNGSGTVYKRGSTYTVKVRHWNGAQLVSMTKGGYKTKREALASVPSMMDKVRLHQTDKIGFCDMWEKVKQTERYKNLSEDKKNAWKYAYQKCGILYSVKDIREIRYEHLQALVSGLTYYPAKDIKTVLGAMYQLAEKMDLCDKNYAAMIELPKNEAQKEKEVFTNDEIQKIWNCSEPFADYILIMLYCGLRPVEMRNLKAEDVHLEEKYLTGGRKTELAKKMWIVIPDVIIHLFEDFRPWKLGKNAFEERFAKTLKAAGIERDLTPGCCRHTFVTNLTLVEDSTAMIQKAARHTKYQTTLNYTHIPIKDVRETVNKLDNIIPLSTKCQHSASND